MTQRKLLRTAKTIVNCTWGERDDIRWKDGTYDIHYI